MIEKLIEFERKNTQLAARIEIALSMIFFTIIQAILHEIHNITMNQFLIIRGPVIIVFNHLFIYYTDDKSNIIYPKSKRQQYLLIFQAFVMVIQVLFFLYSNLLLDFSISIICYNTYNLWVQIFCHFILKDQFSKNRIILIFLGMIGFGMIVLSNIQKSLDLNLLGFLFSFLASISYALALTLVKQFDKVGSITPIQYYNFMCIVVSILSGLTIQDINSLVVDAHLQDFIQMIIAIILSIFAQSLLYRAYQQVNAAKLAPYTFTNIICSIVIDLVVFQKVPNFMASFGCLIVCISIVLSLYNDFHK